MDGDERHAEEHMELRRRVRTLEGRVSELVQNERLLWTRIGTLETNLQRLLRESEAEVAA